MMAFGIRRFLSGFAVLEDLAGVACCSDWRVIRSDWRPHCYNLVIMAPITSLLGLMKNWNIELEMGNGSEKWNMSTTWITCSLSERHFSIWFVSQCSSSINTTQHHTSYHQLHKQLCKAHTRQKTYQQRTNNQEDLFEHLPLNQTICQRIREK